MHFAAVYALDHRSPRLGTPAALHFEPVDSPVQPLSAARPQPVTKTRRCSAFDFPSSSSTKTSALKTPRASEHPRAWREAIEKRRLRGTRCVTSYGDLSQFAQQQSRASAFILSDRRRRVHARPRAGPGRGEPAQAFIEEIRFKNADIPIYIYGETQAPHASTSPTTSCASCTASSTCSRTRPNLWPGTSSAKRKQLPGWSGNRRFSRL
jgi:hypothetical protein